jgi:cobalt-zinc-cadmium efflux system membrane fusion protein
MKSVLLVLGLSVPLAFCSREDAAPAAPKPDANIINIGLDAQKNAGVVVAPAAVTDLTEYLHVAATVQPIDSRVASVRALAPGRIHDVIARVGDRVDTGQPLALVDIIEAGDLGSQSAAAKAELTRLAVQEANARRHAERSRSLAGIGATSQRELELAEGEHAATVQAVKSQESVIAGLDTRLRRLGLSESGPQASSIATLRSPFAGVVIRAHAAPGDVVDSDVTLFAVADLSEIWVQAEVYEKDLGRVQVGQPALIAVDTYPGVTFTGRVAYVSDVLDPKTRTAQVRCVVPNRDRKLKLDMLVSASVPTTASRNALAVSSAAVQELAGQQVVFVRKSDTTFEVREVKVGAAAGDRIEIVSGLREGEAVAIQGAHHLKSIRLSAELGEG